MAAKRVCKERMVGCLPPPYGVGRRDKEGEKKISLLGCQLLHISKALGTVFFFPSFSIGTVADFLFSSPSLDLYIWFVSPCVEAKKEILIHTFNGNGKRWHKN